ncbi:sugar phosphate isomerase/epimerase [soil metagenome]
MSFLNARQLGFCSWSVRPQSVEDLIEAAKQIGLSRVQLALVPLIAAPSAWADCFAKLRDAGIHIVNGMVGCVGEDFSTIAAIRRTCGVVPDETWPQSRERMKLAAPIAAAAGIGTITLHMGFIPANTSNLIYQKIIDRVRIAADLFAEHGIAIAMETGQEPAVTLLTFIHDLGRDSVRINFDPANMLLYGSGDPIEALKLFAPRVGSVHIKDANRAAIAGEWGKEVPIGAGQVDWQAFFAILREANFSGPLTIEREAGIQRVADIRSAKEFVGTLLG